MSDYRVIVPFVHDMGSISPFHASSCRSESKEANALWTINSMRDHDGLKHLTKLPIGTKFERISTYEKLKVGTTMESMLK